MTPAIRDRIAKVKALISSPHKGEADNARRMYRQLVAKHGDPAAAGTMSAEERQRRDEINDDVSLQILQEQRLDAVSHARRWLRRNGFAVTAEGELRAYWQKSTLRYVVRQEHSGTIIANVCWTELSEFVSRLQQAAEGI